MKQIHFLGQTHGSTGYANHGRNLVNQLYKHYPNTSWSTNLEQNWEFQANDAEIAMNKNKNEHDTYIMLGLPQYWRMALSEKPRCFIGFLVWEGDAIPEYWLQYLDDERVDQIWVPSTHVKTAIKNTILRCEIRKYGGEILQKVKIIPHGVDTELFKPNKSKTKRPFTFVACKGWARGMDDRGGLQFTLKAFHEEFKQDEDVRLLVKINSVYNPAGWDLKEEMKKLGIIKNKNIKVTTQDMEYKAMPNFYNSGDIFISTSMAEGFNLPCLEAMACGLPVIATGFGGHTDFVNLKNGMLLKEFKEVTPIEPMYEEIKWVQQDIIEIREVMRLIFENGKSFIEKGSRETALKYTWDNTGELAHKAIEELE